MVSTIQVTGMWVGGGTGYVHVRGRVCIYLWFLWLFVLPICHKDTKTRSHSVGIAEINGCFRVKYYSFYHGNNVTVDPPTHPPKKVVSNEFCCFG